MQRCMLVDTRRARQNLLATLALLLAAAAPASAAIVVNEVESSGIFDFVELTNTGAAPVNIGGYILKRQQQQPTLAVPAGTMLTAGGYYVQRVDPVPGELRARRRRLGAGVHAGERLLDGYQLDRSNRPRPTGAAPTAPARCRSPSKPSPGAANTCPAPIAASAWPGGRLDRDRRRRGRVRQQHERARLPAVGHGRAGHAVGGAQQLRGRALHAVQAHVQRHDLGRTPRAGPAASGCSTRPASGDPDTEGVTLGRRRAERRLRRDRA